MHFLEPPRVVRTPSTEEFVIDEDGSSDVDNNSSRRGSLSNSSQSNDFSVPQPPSGGLGSAWKYGVDVVVKKNAGRKFCIACLCFLCIILATGFSVVLFLYIQTWPSFEVCRSKECTKTATLFLNTMDDTIDPCEDFPKFACGNWLSDTASTVSVGTYDHTTVMRDRVIGRLRVLTENISDTDIEPLRQVKFMYDTCSDTEALEELGLNPITKLLRDFIQPDVSLPKLIAKIKRGTGQHYLFDFTLGADYRNTSRNTIFIDQPQLPVDSSIFVEGADLGTAYKKLIDNSFGLIHKSGYEGISGIIKNNLKNGSEKIAVLEQQLSEAMSDIHSMSKAAMFNLLSLRELNIIFDTELKLARAGRAENSSLNSNFTISPINRFRSDSNGNGNGNENENENELGHKDGNGSDSDTTQKSPVTPHAEPAPAPAPAPAPVPVPVPVPEIGLAFNWTEYLTALFEDIPEAGITENTQIIITDMAYVKSLAKILANLKREDMELYLSWQLIYSFGKDVSKDFRGLFYTFSQLQDGSESIPNRHTECLNLLDYNLPYALTYKYVEKFVANEIISEAHEMVQNLLKAFKDMVSGTAWMDKNTKFRAKLKADRMRAFMGYPNWMRNESAVIHYHQGLAMNNISFFENMITMQNWLTMKDLRRISLAVDTAWISDSPAEADAFYDDEINAITFPSGFLQEPFFGMGLRSINYGALGAVIGHEITHGFDTRGRYSDEKGRLNSWWSIPTLMQFVRKSQCFVTQYNNYTLPELADTLGTNNHLNGRRTLAENIADNGGVREAFLAYKLYVKESLGGREEPRLPGLEKYNPQQLFFLSFAQSWCSYMNPASLLETVQTNEHSPSRFRIIGPLTNFDEFSDVWQCKSGSFMNPPNKCVLW